MNLDKEVLYRSSPAVPLSHTGECVQDTQRRPEMLKAAISMMMGAQGTISKIV